MWTSRRLLAALLLCLATGCSADECQSHVDIHHYYRELGCRPLPGDDVNNCPKEYNCTGSLDDRDPNKCYRDGKVYELDTEVPTVEGACQFQCRCESGSVNCRGVVDCFQYQNGYPEGCQPRYEKGQCCPSGLNCLNATDPDAFTCQYGGKTFALGQYIHQSDRPCQSCKCQEDFDGTLNGPWCSDVGCGLHFRYKGYEKCAPIFFADPERCCPNNWRCPTGTDTVVPGPSRKKSSTAGTCKFGNLTLAVGDGLSTSLEEGQSCVECSCILPPYATCVQKESWCS